MPSWMELNLKVYRDGVWRIKFSQQKKYVSILKRRLGKNSIWPCSASWNSIGPFTKILKLKLWEKMRLSILKKHCWKQSLKLQDHKGIDARSKFKKLLPTLFCKRRHSDGVPDEKVGASTHEKNAWITEWIFYQRKVRGTSGVSWFWTKDYDKSFLKEHEVRSQKPKALPSEFFVWNWICSYEERWVQISW